MKIKIYKKETMFGKLKSGDCFILVGEEKIPKNIKLKTKDEDCGYVSLYDGKIAYMNSLNEVLLLPGAKVVVK